MTRQVALVVCIALICLAVIMVTALLMGHDSTLVTTAVGIISAVVAAALGIGGGVAVRDKQWRSLLDTIARSQGGDGDVQP